MKTKQWKYPLFVSLAVRKIEIQLMAIHTVEFKVDKRNDFFLNYTGSETLKIPSHP